MLGSWVTYLTAYPLNFGSKEVTGTKLIHSYYVSMCIAIPALQMDMRDCLQMSRQQSHLKN